MNTKKTNENGSKTSMDAGAIHSRQRITQNFLLIWVDANIDESTENHQSTVAQLRSVVNDVNIFTKWDEAVDFLTEVYEMKAFLIADDTIGQQVVPLIHDIPQLDSIYIFCSKQIQHQQWAENWVKIRGVHTDAASVCQALHQAAKQCDQDSIAVSFATVNEETVNQNLNQLEPSFMYTQIFKEILLDMKYDEKSIKDLANYCREFYPGNTKELLIINEFEHTYRSKSPIWWYTRECFTYQMLNRALRTLEGSTIINMGFFISDLHQQLKQLHQKQIDSYQGKSFIVYRGQGLSYSDFEKLQKTKRGLMSFNNFLSTSKNRDVSLHFAKTALTKTNMVGILFQMSINPTVSSAPFASIPGVSYFKKEEEILFSMHTVFRVDEITKMDNNNSLYQVNLKLTADDDQELRILTKRIEQEITGETGWKRLGHLLLILDQFEKAEELYDALLKQTFDQSEKASYYNQLAYIKDHQGDYKKAIEYYEKSLEIFEKTLPPNHPGLSTSYNNIAVVYDNMGEYSKALSFYEKSFEIRQKTLPPNHPSLATSYNNISLVYQNMGEYSKALSFYEKSFEIRQKTLPPNHPSLAASYNNISLVYKNMGEYSKALSFNEKSLEIRQKTLPPNHPGLAVSYNNIAGVYENMREYSKALSFYEKSFEIRQKTLPPNHPDLAISYNDIAVLYQNMGEYSKALSFYEKSLEIRQKTLPPNHPLLAISYNNIGLVYTNIEEYSKALSFYEKSLEIRQKTLPPNHPDLATSYNNIAVLYQNMGEYSKALSFYEKAIEIRQKTLPPNHPDLANSYNNIAAVHQNMGEYARALSFYKKSLEISQKTHPPNHHDLATSYNNIAGMYPGMGEYAKALSFYEKSLEISQKFLPRKHPLLATSYNNIGFVYRNMGEYSKALSYYERALEIFQSVLPANHRNIKSVQENINILKRNL
jgi:tetratricopeptide (TPR) repeat protein